MKRYFVTHEGINEYLHLALSLARSAQRNKAAASLLRSALGQAIESDDQVILGRVEEALKILEEK